MIIRYNECNTNVFDGGGRISKFLSVPLQVLWNLLRSCSQRNTQQISTLLHSMKDNWIHYIHDKNYKNSFSCNTLFGLANVSITNFVHLQGLSHIDPYAWIVLKFGLSSCWFLKIWHWLSLCKSVHPQISLIGWPIAPPWFLGSGHSVDSVLAMCAHPLGIHMHFMPKSIVFVHTSIIEDNAFMWFPLAFQVQYLDFYICFIAYRVL